jgi:protein phosphatase methylesterase 1
MWEMGFLWVPLSYRLVQERKGTFLAQLMEGIRAEAHLGSPERRIHLRRYGPTDDEWAASRPGTASPHRPPPVLFCVHGAGMSSMSFGPVASMIAGADSVDEHPFCCRVMSMDLRCHGDSDDGGEEGEAGLTLDALVRDFVDVVLWVKKTYFPNTEQFFYAGHSLGGSVVAFGATHPTICMWLGGVVMLDIVESVAKLSLKYMPSVLDKRPSSFTTTREAAHWFVTSGGMFNEAIAQLTTPFLLRCAESGSASQRFVWRTNLRRTEPCWPTWFEGLDTKFVTLPCPKMLLLASTDRLDKALTTAQMQGKFQLEVVGTQGHYVMEDEPTTVASKLMRFVNRVDVLSSKLSLLNSRRLSNTALPSPPPV